MLDRKLLKRAAAHLEAEAKAHLERAERWSRQRSSRVERADDAKAYDQWAKLHRVAKAIVKAIEEDKP
jgi:hypothetical protein